MLPVLARPFASGPLNRRSLLTLAAAAPLLAAAGCAPGASANGLRPDGALRVATYITPGYTDLYPGIERFNESLTAELGADIVDFIDSGALLNAEQLVPGMVARGVTDVGFQTSSYVLLRASRSWALPNSRSSTTGSSRCAARLRRSRPS